MIEVLIKRTNRTIHSDLVELVATLFVRLISVVAVCLIGSLLSAASCVWLRHCPWGDGCRCCFTVGFLWF